jgi:hypothetical protein
MHTGPKEVQFRYILLYLFEEAFTHIGIDIFINFLVTSSNGRLILHTHLAFFSIAIQMIHVYSSISKIKLYQYEKDAVYI